MALAWWKPRTYSDSVLRQAQDSVNRRNAGVVNSGEPTTEGKLSPVAPDLCFHNSVVAGDDANLLCPVHKHEKCPE